MMKVLVIAVNYPDLNGGVSLMYIHTRNKYYVEHGIDVDVISVAAKEHYTIDGVNVIPLTEYEKHPVGYELLILHAAEMSPHFDFIRKYGDLFKKLLFFHHGHESLSVNRVYPKPYPYLAKHHIAAYIHQELHDIKKLSNWRRTLPLIQDKSYHIFVSRWMKDEFLKNTKVPERVIDGHYHIIYNCVGEEFEQTQYDLEYPKEYDFVTIRGNIDGSKYCVDVVNKLAWDNPDKKFLLVGKGGYFDHYEKAPNIDWHNGTMNHDDIVLSIQKSCFALMPTRTDSQGLMACEMAAMGIPLITSDIPVCHEIFDNCDNVSFIDNSAPSLDFSELETFQSIKDNRFFRSETVIKELQVIQGFCS